MWLRSGICLGLLTVWSPPFLDVVFSRFLRRMCPAIVETPEWVKYGHFRPDCFCSCLWPMQGNALEKKHMVLPQKTLKISKKHPSPKTLDTVKRPYKHDGTEFMGHRKYSYKWEQINCAYTFFSSFHRCNCACYPTSLQLCLLS